MRDRVSCVVVWYALPVGLKLRCSHFQARSCSSEVLAEAVGLPALKVPRSATPIVPVLAQEKCAPTTSLRLSSPLIHHDRPWYSTPLGSISQLYQISPQLLPEGYLWYDQMARTTAGQSEALLLPAVWCTTRCVTEVVCGVHFGSSASARCPSGHPQPVREWYDGSAAFSTLTRWICSRTRCGVAPGLMKETCRRRIAGAWSGPVRHRCIRAWMERVCLERKRRPPICSSVRPVQQSPGMACHGDQTPSIVEERISSETPSSRCAPSKFSPTARKGSGFKMGA